MVGGIDEGGGGGGARRVAVVDVDEEDAERAVSFGEVGTERGGVCTDAGETDEGDLEAGLCGSLGGPRVCDLALFIAEPQSKDRVAADMGLMAGVATFSKDSLRLFVSSVVPLLCLSSTLR